jgi:hypothetical protein
MPHHVSSRPATTTGHAPRCPIRPSEITAAVIVRPLIACTDARLFSVLDAAQPRRTYHTTGRSTLQSGVLPSPIFSPRSAWAAQKAKSWR